MGEVCTLVLFINHRFHVSMCVVCPQVCQEVRDSASGDTFSCGRTAEAVFTVTNSSSFTLFLKGGDEYTDMQTQEKFTRYNQRREASVCVCVFSIIIKYSTSRKSLNARVTCPCECLRGFYIPSRVRVGPLRVRV